MDVPTVVFRAAYGYDAKAASDDAVIPADQQGESLTVQSMSEEADLNVLMQRFGITGRLPDAPVVPSYGDFSGVKDYQSALHVVLDAQEQFMQWPADVRARFSNDPQKFLEFCTALTPDGKLANITEMRKLGLANPEDVSRGTSNPPAPPAPSGGGSS